MALAKYNATLEDKTNIVEFTLLDDLGEFDEDGFNTNPKFRVSREDGVPMVNPGVSGHVVSGGSLVVSAVGYTTNSAYVKFSVDLSAEVDNVGYDYDHPEYHHNYSIQDSNGKVYLYGKLNIVRIP